MGTVSTGAGGDPLERLNAPVELRSFDTLPGFVTVLIVGDPASVSVEVVPEGLLADVLKGTRPGGRRAVKVHVVHDGKDILGWVDRKYFAPEMLRAARERARKGSVKP